MCDASEHAAGYVLLIEDCTEKEGGKPENTRHSRLSFEVTSRIPDVSYDVRKKVLVLHFAFIEIGHFLWGAKSRWT